MTQGEGEKKLKKVNIPKNCDIIPPPSPLAAGEIMSNRGLFRNNRSAVFGGKTAQFLTPPPPPPFSPENQRLMRES